MMNRDDLETVEKEFAARLGTRIDELRARRAHCPPIVTRLIFSVPPYLLT